MPFIIHCLFCATPFVQLSDRDAFCSGDCRLAQGFLTDHAALHAHNPSPSAPADGPVACAPQDAVQAGPVGGSLDSEQEYLKRIWSDPWE